MKIKGAQIFFECLKKEGVEVVFGFPGGAVLDIYHEMASHDIRHILVRHEQGAAHMADGYARASGRVGVCLVTSGPGATNTVTGIATAYMDSVPMVIFTGQVPTPLIGDDAFQEVDIIGITRPCTKHSYLVRDVADLATVIKEAFYLARTGRPGPVLVDLPKDVIQASNGLQVSQKSRSARLPSHGGGACGPGEKSLRADRQGQVAGHLRRRRHNHLGIIRGVDETRPAHPGAGNLLAARSWRLSGHHPHFRRAQDVPTRYGSECRGCTALTRQTWPSPTPMSSLLSAPASTTG